ncbi:hypothetical protein HYH03_008134 [Edaphochlamys debaryana]|uniref:Uncharacterized protein n=1 Tax=Edaphochlamys debaryana TaxID=47281 RepID=A0A836BZ58_9CHLO|nr:hypothetical protein HYH03_008134 [Edaphochlamys debaryana]|eukprot:KAG2493617.1 hypothetical protein HYH03_008134 [Edaphochlamys debaryana]
MLCANESATVPTELKDNAVAMVKHLLVPTARRFLLTPTGSVIADALNHDLGFDPATMDQFVTSDNLAQLIALFRAVGRYINPWSLVDAAYMEAWSLAGGGDDWESDGEWETSSPPPSPRQSSPPPKGTNPPPTGTNPPPRASVPPSPVSPPSPPTPPSPRPTPPSPPPAPPSPPPPRSSPPPPWPPLFVDDSEWEGQGSGLDGGPFALISLFGSLATELGALDSRLSMRRVLLDFAELLAAMTRVALGGAPSGTAAGSFTASLFNMSDSERAMFRGMNASLVAMQAATEATCRAVENYPDFTPALSEPAALNLPDNVTASVMPPLSAGSQAQIDACKASSSGGSSGGGGSSFPGTGEVTDGTHTVSDGTTNTVGGAVTGTTTNTATTVSGGTTSTINGVGRRSQRRSRGRALLVDDTKDDHEGDIEEGDYDYDLLGGLGDLLAGSLARSPFFTSSMAVFPGTGAMMRTVFVVARWWAERWDTAMRPVMAKAFCADRGTVISDAEADHAVDFMTYLGMPLLQRLFTTNTGVILKSIIKEQMGFNVSTIPGYLTRARVREAAAAVQALEDVDYALDYTVPGVALAIPYFILNAGELDSRFNTADVILDVMAVLQRMAEIPLEGPNTTSSSSSGRRLLQSSDSAFAQAMLTMTEAERAVFMQFLQALSSVQAAAAGVMSTMGVQQGAPLPGASPRTTSELLAPSPSPSPEDDGGLSDAARIGIIVGCSVGGALVLALIIVVIVVVVRKKKNGGEGGGAGGSGNRVQPSDS